MFYFSTIDHRLNDADQNDLYNDKNNLDRLFGCDNLPETVLRRISGCFSNRDYDVLSQPSTDFPPVDLILKPSFDTSAGQDVELLRYVNGRHVFTDGRILADVDLTCDFGQHFIIQKMIRQHDFCASFNPGSINTFRVFIYRSVIDEQIHVLKVVFKTGCGNTVVDNQVAGGVVSVVDSEGCLADFALTALGEKVMHHPGSQREFKGAVVPHFDKIISFAKSLGNRVATHRTMGLDVALTENNEAKLIEANPMSVAIDIMQCDGGPLFGEFSDEVRDYCVAHPEMQRKKIIRP
ncbi:MAG: sugar-transfer associated ATP-grasp domain-containing protein [Pseudomonadales bacterium]